MLSKRSSELGTPTSKRSNNEDDNKRPTMMMMMMLTITFPDSGFPAFSFTATEKSVVEDAAEAAAEEWGTDAKFLELSFAGEVLQPGRRLVGQCGVVADSTLEASLVRCIGKKLLLHALEKGRKTLLWLIQGDGNHTLRLDTPTFADENGLLAFDSDWIPKQAGVTSICFDNPDPSVTAVAPDFLRGSTTLTSVGLAGLQNVTALGKGFLMGCDSLTAIDLSTLQNIKSIDYDFLRACSRLKTVSNMSALSNVTSIGEFFLEECSSLESVDLSCFVNVEEIKSGFLLQCSSLKAISNMSALSNVTSIGDHFLEGCSSLGSVDLIAFERVAVVGSNFLSECSSLKGICNISGLRNVKKVGESFLLGCCSLTPIDASVPGWKDLSGDLRKEFEKLP